MSVILVLDDAMTFGNCILRNKQKWIGSFCCNPTHPHFLWPGIYPKGGWGSDNVLPLRGSNQFVACVFEGLATYLPAIFQKMDDHPNDSIRLFARCGHLPEVLRKFLNNFRSSYSKESTLTTLTLTPPQPTQATTMANPAYFPIYLLTYMRGLF